MAVAVKKQNQAKQIDALEACLCIVGSRRYEYNQQVASTSMARTAVNVGHWIEGSLFKARMSVLQGVGSRDVSTLHG